MNLTYILLVDDDVEEAKSIRKSLDKLKFVYKLFVARTANEALEILSVNTVDQLPDVVLINNQLGEFKGVDFLAELRRNEEWKHLKCFILANSDDVIDRHTARQLKISGIIVKPLKSNSTASMNMLNMIIDLMNIKA